MACVPAKVAVGMSLSCGNSKEICFLKAVLSAWLCVDLLNR